MTRARLVACAALAIALVASPARADDDPDALLDRGVALREAGKDEEALALFRRALEQRPTPRARAQVALAEQALGMWVKAERDLTAALASVDDPWIARNRAALEGALATIGQHVGTLEVRSAREGEIYLDGVRVGSTTDRSVRAEAGRRTLEIRATGFHPVIRAVDIRAGGVTRETISLSPLPPRTASGPAAPPARESRDQAPPPRDGSTQRAIGWVVLGTGGALLATGGVGLAVRASAISDYNRDCPGLGAAQPPECDAKIDSARTWLTVSIVSLVGGGVLTLGGAGLLLFAPSRDPEPRRAARLSCAPTLGGVTCGGAFF